MKSKLKKGIENVRTGFFVLLGIALLAGFGLYEDYKLEKDLFVFASIGLLTFVAIFYSLIFNDKFSKVSNAITDSLDKEVDSKKETLIQLINKGEFKQLRVKTRDIEDVKGVKQLVDVKSWLFYGVVSLILSIPALIVLSDSYIGAAYFTFWMGWVFVSMVILLWYFVYSEI